MTIVTVEKWVVKPEKRDEYTKVMQRYRKYIADNPELFKEIKSVKEYTQLFGETSGMNILLIEYNSLADYEKLHVRMREDETTERLEHEWQAVVDSATVSLDVWTYIGEWDIKGKA